MRRRFYYTLAKLFFIIATPIILLVLPANYFDSGQSICLSKLFFDFECLACGMSRACMHLIHFDFEEAYAYNMASFLVLPLLGIVWIQWFIKEWKLYKRYRTAFAVKQTAD